jgi:hypothetical protein
MTGFMRRGVKEVVRVVASIAEEGLASGMGKQLLGGGHFVVVPRRERDVDRTALGVDNGVELG